MDYFTAFPVFKITFIFYVFLYWPDFVFPFSNMCLMFDNHNDMKNLEFPI